MEFIWLVIFTASIILTAAESSNTTVSVNQTGPLEQNSTGDSNATETNSTARRGRQLQINRIELPFSGTEVKRHIVKIPPNVSRVKVIGNTPVARPRKLLHRRIVSTPFYSYEGKTNQKLPQDSEENDYDRMDADSFPPSSGVGNELRRNFRKLRGPEAVYDEVYDENANLGLGHYLSKEEPFKYKKFRLSNRPVKSKRKIPNEGLDHGGGKFVDSDDKEYAVVKNRYRLPEREEAGFYEYEPIEPPRYLKQYSSGTYGLKTKYVPDIIKHSEKPVYGKFYEPGTHLTLKRIPSKGKKVPLNPQYTTHNPQVATNFGLTAFSKPNGFSLIRKVPFGDSSIFGGATLENFNNPVASASEHSNQPYPGLTPGIKVIQPPQFGEASVSYPPSPSRLTSAPSQQSVGPTGSQKATIRDILEQDCPGYETIGYCESPPRYPMHQINLIVKKCASLMDVMSTPNVVSHKEYSGLPERRIDENVDNATVPEDNLDHEKHVRSKRTASEGVQACRSELSTIEPGYAKEETTGRWFVIVQYPDLTQQKITTDSCKSPGKPCAGFTEMKCIRAYSSSSTYATTKCVQKYAYHKLISWDPDSPDTCPRMRTFKFPSSCVCHVGVV